MRIPQFFLLVFTGVPLIFLAACNQSGAPTAGLETSPVTTVAPTITSPAGKSPASPTGAHGGQGGQIIETGIYHLEFVALPESTGTHLDFFLQKGESHTPVPDADVIVQVQFPDGSQKSLEMQYKPEEKHYTVLLPGALTGEYKVVILSNIGGEKVNGRFSFKR